MKLQSRSFSLLSTSILAAGLLLSGCATTETASPTVPLTYDGLMSVGETQWNAVYVRPSSSLSGYTKVVLLEPTISFRKGWKEDVNEKRYLSQITEDDMEKAIVFGKDMLAEIMAEELEESGFELVSEAGPEVMAIEPSITNLDIFTPAPGAVGDLWSSTYSSGSGRATLTIEIYDSVTQQILLRAVDTKSNEYKGLRDLAPTTTETNIADAEAAFTSWAEMLVTGLENLQDIVFPSAEDMAE